MTALTVFGIAVTVGAYRLSLWARKRFPSPLTTPVLFSTVIVITVLLTSDISFAEYSPAKDVMTFLLGPATVALALPLYKNREAFLRNIVPAGGGLLAGSLGTIIIAGLTARILGFTSLLTSSIAIKSTTVPIAIEIAKIVHGNPALTAIFVVISGILGASTTIAPAKSIRCSARSLCDSHDGDPADATASITAVRSSNIFADCPHAISMACAKWFSAVSRSPFSRCTSPTCRVSSASHVRLHSRVISTALFDDRSGWRAACRLSYAACLKASGRELPVAERRRRIPEGSADPAQRVDGRFWRRCPDLARDTRGADEPGAPGSSGSGKSFCCAGSVWRTRSCSKLRMC